MNVTEHIQMATARMDVQCHSCAHVPFDSLILDLGDLVFDGFEHLSEDFVLD